MGWPKSRYADTVGDGSGIKNANGDYSLSPTIFRIKPGVDRVINVTRLIVYIRDTGTLDADSYGNGIVLTNGIKFQLVRFAGLSNETILWGGDAGLPVLSNSHWKRICHDEIHSSFGTGDESVTYRYTFTRDTNGSPIRLDDANKDEIQIILEDDFSGLVEHYFRFGIY